MNHDGLILRMGAMPSRDHDVPDATALYLHCNNTNHHNHHQEESSLRIRSNPRPPSTQPVCESITTSPAMGERTKMLDRTIPEYIFILTDEESDDDDSTTSDVDGIGPPRLVLLPSTPLRHGNVLLSSSTTTTTTSTTRKNVENESQVVWQKRGRFLIWPAHLGDCFDSLANQ